KLDGFVAQESGKQDLIETVRQRSGRSKGIGGITTQSDGPWHSLPPLVITPAMSGPDLVDLPMHSGCSFVVDLHPVHAEIAGARVWVPGMNVWQRDESSAIFWPALQHRQIVQRELRSVLVQTMDDLLARAVFTMFR